MSLADYLAKNYLTADSEKKSKKRKRKNKEGGLVIDDDDSLGWKTKEEKDDEDAPMIGMDADSLNLERALMLQSVEAA
jgi:pre-mRNA-splicing factor CWC26